MLSKESTLSDQARSRHCSFASEPWKAAGSVLLVVAGALATFLATQPWGADPELPGQHSRQDSFFPGALESEGPKGPLLRQSVALVTPPWQAYVSVCLVCKDDNLDIAEWVEYHRRIGVGVIYVIDNGSREPLINNLLLYITSGFVVYSNIGKTPGAPQFYAYEFCVRVYGNRHRWMGFLDSDEFVVIPSGEKIGSVLKRYEEFNGLVLNWRMYGSSGHVDRPAGGILRNFNRCKYGGMDHVKTFANPRKIHEIINPHYVVFQEGGFSNNTARCRAEPLAGRHSNMPPLLDVMFINHYVLKSQEDFLAKARRGAADGTHKDLGFFHVVDADSNDTCPVLEMPPVPDNDTDASSSPMSAHHSALEPAPIQPRELNASEGSLATQFHVELNSYVALCVVSKDDNLGIAEWVEYHRGIGFGFIYVIDHGSKQPLASSLGAYITSGFVVYTYLPPSNMSYGYQYCARVFGYRHRWMGFLNSDEFVVVPSGEDVGEALVTYERLSSVVLNLHVVGSSESVGRLDGGVLKNDEKCKHEGSSEVRTFADPARICKFDGPRFVWYTKHGFSVNTGKKEFEGPFHRPRKFNVAQLNKYVLKSLEGALLPCLLSLEC